MSDRGLLSDVADAVISRQDVDWERCAERARPAERRALDHLRTFARICGAAGQQSGAAAGPTVHDRRGSRHVRRAIGALVVLALVQSVVGLATGVALLPAATGGMLAALVGPTPAARRTQAGGPRHPSPAGRVGGAPRSRSCSGTSGLR